MAELVGVIGVPHNPLLYRATADGTPDDLAATVDNYEMMGQHIRDADADAIVFVGSDHFRKYSYTNCPAFVVGKAPMFHTTYENEMRHFGLDEWSVAGDEDLAQALLGGRELPEEIDFGFANEWVLDHCYSVPLHFLRPEWDLPVVPIHTNTNLPPTPRASRFSTLGRYLRDAIAAAPLDRRIALIVTGHLATDIGGPKAFLGGDSPDEAFDEAAVAWMANGDLDGAVDACTAERLLEAGNVTPQFMNFVAGLAASGGRPADFAEGTPSRFAAAPFFYWGAP